MDLALARRLQTQGISDTRVLTAIASLRRADFLPEDVVPWAFDDRPLEIGFGQTISQPYIVGYMSQALELTGTERVLEIGTGSGWQAAVLGKLAAEVWTLERIPALADRARRVLERLGQTNVHVQVADGFAGLIERAPFDAIVLTAAPLRMPERLLTQLAPGGRLVAPIGPTSGTQELVRVRRGEDGSFSSEQLLDVRFVPMVADGASA